MSSRSLALMLGLGLINAVGCATAADDAAIEDPSNQDPQAQVLADRGDGTVYGIHEGSPDAIGMLRVSNELSYHQLHSDAGVWSVSAHAIILYRDGYSTSF